MDSFDDLFNVASNFLDSESKKLWEVGLAELNAFATVAVEKASINAIGRIAEADECDDALMKEVFEWAQSDASENFLQNVEAAIEMKVELLKLNQQLRAITSCIPQSLLDDGPVAKAELRLRVVTTCQLLLRDLVDGETREQLRSMAAGAFENQLPSGLSSMLY